MKETFRCSMKKNMSVDNENILQTLFDFKLQSTRTKIHECQYNRINANRFLNI